MKLVKFYEQLKGSKIVHTRSFDCHYMKRSNKTISVHLRKPRDCSVCDQCQRLAKKAKIP